MKKIFLLLASLLSICVFSDRLDFSELVKKQSNSVVNIQATRKVYSNRSSMGSFPNDIFREFGFPQKASHEMTKRLTTLAFY